MLASYKQDGAPVALIPGASGRYRMADPHTSRSVPVNAQRAALLNGTAYFFYCPLPDERTSNAASLLGMVFNRVWSDLARLVGAGILSGLAMLAPAVFLGAIASQVLPSGDLRALVMLTAAMALGGLVLGLGADDERDRLMRLEGGPPRASAQPCGTGCWSSPHRSSGASPLATWEAGLWGFNGCGTEWPAWLPDRCSRSYYLLPASALMLVYDSALGGLGLGLGVASLAVTAVHRCAAVATPPPVTRRLAPVDRCAASTHQRRGQAEGRRSGRIRVRHVGGPLPRAEADRDEAG